MKLYLTPSDEKTVEELSKAVGKTTKKVVTQSRAIGKMPFEGRSQSVRTEEVSLLPEDEARRLPLEEIVMVIDAQMPIRAKRIEYFNDPYFKGIHGAQSGELPFPEKEVSTSVGVVEEEHEGEDAKVKEVLDMPEPVASPASPAPAASQPPTPAAPAKQGKLQIEPVDRQAPPRESIKMAAATNRRETLRTSRRKKAKGVVAVEADQQRQIELDLATQTELTLVAPSDADVVELQRAMGELEDFKKDLPEEAEVTQVETATV